MKKSIGYGSEAEIDERIRSLESKKSQTKAKSATTTTAKLRSSITPGTVLILLAGRFRGKRVVFLKQLASGLLLVTGPYSTNGVPLRRVNQRYCIATSASVDVKKVDVADVTDGFFAREAKAATKKDEAAFFGASGEKTVLSEEKKAKQKKVDEPV